MLVYLFCTEKKTAKDSVSDFNDGMVFAAKRNFYVDDLLKSLRTSQDTIKMQRELSMSCLTRRISLDKSKQQKRSAESISENEMSKELKNMNLEDDALPSEEAFGLHWDVKGNLRSKKELSSNERA